MTRETSNGSTASYYELPAGATQLQDLISHRNLNAQDGEIFRAIYRKGLASHSDALRDARKVLFYAEAEVKRLEALQGVGQAQEFEFPHISWFANRLGVPVSNICDFRLEGRRAHFHFPDRVVGRFEDRHFASWIDSAFCGTKFTDVKIRDTGRVMREVSGVWLR